MSRVTHFDLHKLREIADEGIARHGLRGYARRLGLDVSTVRSLRDGRDMQISKVTEIVAALDLTLDLQSGPPSHPAGTQPGGGDAAMPTAVPIAYHARAPQSGPAPVAFRVGWLTGQGWTPARLRCVDAPRGTDASCVMPGALCLLDCTRDWPGAHAIWAYLDGGALRISYLSRPHPGVLLISGRNPSIPTRQVTGAALDAITPLGQVVWSGALLTDPAQA